MKFIHIQGGSNMTGTDLYVYGDTLPHTVVGVSLWWISADGTFYPTRNLITMRCSTLRGTFCSLITLATPRQDWTGSNPSRREGGGCGVTLSRSHNCCAVRLVYIQLSPGHIWTTLYQCVPRRILNVYLFILTYSIGLWDNLQSRIVMFITLTVL